MSNSVSEFGIFAEDLAVEFLEKKNYRILGQNFRRPWGELDIIAEKDGVIVFVEVKANKEFIPGFEPETRAGFSKMHKVLRTAKLYLSEKNLGLDREWRIDLISITLVRERGVAKIRHYKNLEVE